MQAQIHHAVIYMSLEVKNTALILFIGSNFAGRMRSVVIINVHACGNAIDHMAGCAAH